MYHASRTDDIIGKPFKARGRGPDAFGCEGLVYYFYDEILERVLPAFDYETMAGYWQQSRYKFWRELQRRFQVLKEDGRLIRGDILVFDCPDANKPHFGIWLNDGNLFLHVLEGQTVQKTHFVHPWRSWCVIVLRLNDG